LKNVTLHQLRVFEVTARLGSFTRAAEELYLTQPTVSMQIKQLKEAVGLPLFEQLGKRLYLTEAGKELLATCQDIFGRLARFEMTVADMKGLKAGALRLSVVTTAKYFAPRMLGPFCNRYPGINVSLNVMNRERVLNRLEENQDDLYVLGQPPENLGVEMHPFLENPLVVVAPAHHPLARRRKIPLNALKDEQFLMREPGSGTRKAVQEFLTQHGITVPVRMELGSSEAIKQAVVGGLGVSVLSRYAVMLESMTGLIEILDVEGFPLRRNWYVVWPMGKQLSVVARTFVDYLMDEGQQVANMVAQMVQEIHHPFALD
jgi:DNA-binding transcriptional LysR family regulator